MENTKLQAISAKAAEDLQDLISNAEEKIFDAMNAAVEEAQDAGEAAKFRIGFTIKLDLDKNAMQCALTFKTSRKYTSECAIPDPNQIPLPLEQPKTQTEN